MRPSLVRGLLVALVLAFSPAHGALPRATPESQGLSSAGLRDLVVVLDEKVDEMHSLMILRHGKVVAEGWWAPYAAGHNHVLYSLSKSFTSTAVGFAIAEGKLDLFDPVLPFFPNDAPPEPGAALRAMRVRDLLTMSTGHQTEPPRSGEEMTARSFLAHPVAHKPGTHFLYNTPATFMLSALVQQVTGQTVLNYLRPRLFAPLGIEQPVWDANIEGITLGGYGLRIRTEDIASFGQLYQQRGQWQGRQLLPADWIDLATSRQMSNGSNPRSDWDQGYGFQFWRSRHGYRGDGAFGQYCVVLPEQDMVVAITSGTRDMQAVLDLLWEHLLPLVREQPLPTDAHAQAGLKETLAGLGLRMPQGAATSAQAARVLGRVYTAPDNERNLDAVIVRASPDGEGLELVLRTAGTDRQYPLGHRSWQAGRAPVSAGALAILPDEPVAGTYAWESDDVLSIKIAAYETPFTISHRLTFSGDDVTLTTETNVAFGPRHQPTWKGTAGAR
jgi:CubicO group peptidase (beta-lactamase class C family)